MKMESVITDPPCDVAVVAVRRRLIRLTLNASVHDMVSAYGTVINNHIPRP